MYFIVPKDRSIIKNVGKTHNLYDAQKFADKLREETGLHYDVIHMASVYTTQTMAELMEQDMLLAQEGASS
jgi:hypothetical protein